MKTNWIFWLIVALVAVNLYITYRIATGLQSVQAQVTTNPLVKFFGGLAAKVGL